MQPSGSVLYGVHQYWLMSIIYSFFWHRVSFTMAWKSTTYRSAEHISWQHGLLVERSPVAWYISAANMQISIIEKNIVQIATWIWFFLTSPWIMMYDFNVPHLHSVMLNWMEILTKFHMRYVLRLIQVVNIMNTTFHLRRNWFFWLDYANIWKMWIGNQQLRAFFRFHDSTQCRTWSMQIEYE